MPVVRILGEEATRLAPTRYKSEQQLQGLLAEFPFLLMDEGEPDVVLVDQEVTLAGTGRLDLLLVDAEGRPVVVEVKLRRNVQSRREVVAQVFDYVAALSEHTARELDLLLDGKLTAALGQFEAEDDDDEVAAEARRRWDFCSAALRNGNVRVVVAVDEAGPELIRLVRFINDHSDLDIRLVEVTRFGTSTGGTTLVPKILVRTAEEPIKTSRARKPPRPQFEAVVKAYDESAPAELRTRNRARNYRFIGVDGWPDGLHYEFLDGKSDIGVELHIETDRALSVQPTVIGLVGAVQEALPGAKVSYDPKWSRRRGRLVARLPWTVGPGEIGAAMTKLIAVTKPHISAALEAEA